MCDAPAAVATSLPHQPGWGCVLQTLGMLCSQERCWGPSSGRVCHEAPGAISCLGLACCPLTPLFLGPTWKWLLGVTVGTSHPRGR